MNVKVLKSFLRENGYIKSKDYKFIFWRGTEMKTSIRFEKAKMRKNEKEVVKLIEKYLLTVEKYEESTGMSKLHYNIPHWFDLKDGKYIAK